MFSIEAEPHDSPTNNEKMNKGSFSMQFIPAFPTDLKSHSF